MGPARRSAVALTFLALTFAASTARADATARELSKRGYELLLANKCEEAVPLLKKSYELAPEARTLVNLARCEEKTHHLLAAIEHFRAARADTQLTPEMATQLDTMVTDVEKRVPHVILQLSNAPLKTTVRRGQAEIPRSLAEAGVPIDPNELTSFVVSAEGYESKTFSVTLAEGMTKSIEAAPGPRIASAPLVEPPRDEPKRSPLRTVGVVTMIVGGAALAAGGVFGVLAMGKKSDAEDAGCKDRQCPDANAGTLRDDAKSLGTVSTIAFIGGGVLAAAGLSMFIVAPTASSDRVGFTLSGHF